MVLQFVGFLGAWNHPGNLPPLVAAHPRRPDHDLDNIRAVFSLDFSRRALHREIARRKQLTAALSPSRPRLSVSCSISAVWFGLHVFFPANGKVDWFAILLCAAAFVAMLRYKIDIIPVIFGSAIVGLHIIFCAVSDDIDLSQWRLLMRGSGRNYAI